MRAFARLLLACAASLVAYGIVFGAIIHKPLTVDVISDLLRLKEDYARRAASPKLVIFAGSNARFSHSCAVIEKLAGRPCVNFGIARGIGLDYLASELEPLLRRGDVVYMPLEYDWYLDDKVAAMTGPDSALMAYADKRRLLGLGWERTLRAAFSFDLAFAASGAAEMALRALGVQRRVGLQTMDPQGDEIGHDDAEAAPYRAYVASVTPPIPGAAALAAPSYAKDEIAGFLVWTRAHGVAVYGGLPTTFADAPVGADLIAAIRRVYEASGQRFLLLPSHSQYPRDCFFDTYAHLVERCQIVHSEMLAPFLAAALRSD
jgi:hypothetical protein